MINIILDIISYICFIASSFFLLVGAIGLIRMPDFWSRLHAGGLIDTAGLALFLLGLAIQSGFSLLTLKLALIFVFLMITGPTAGHALANAAFISGLKPQGTENKTIKEAKPAKRQGKK